MYLHLGQGVVVPESSVIGIFDLDNTTGSHITRKFLGDAEKAGRVISVSDELPKSFIVCGAEESHSRIALQPGEKMRGCNTIAEMRVYLSQLSSTTLLKRSEAMRFD